METVHQSMRCVFDAELEEEGVGARQLFGDHRGCDVRRLPSPHYRLQDLLRRLCPRRLLVSESISVFGNYLHRRRFGGLRVGHTHTYTHTHTHTHTTA